MNAHKIIYFNFLVNFLLFSVAVKNTEINKILFNCFWQLEIFSAANHSRK
jgi:hypothetical protein